MNKHKKTEYDTHHLVNRSRGWSNDVNNLIRLKRKEHEARHVLFGNDDIKEALLKLFMLWKDAIKDWVLKRELYYCLQNIDIKQQCFNS